MAKAHVSVKIDADVKERAAKLLNSMGLDQTTAIDMFYRQIIAEEKLPFEPVEQSIDEQLLAAIERKNIPVIKLKTDDEGNILIDEDSDPELYDWGVNG
jgi:DNA-damage-inducible protein J